MTSLLALVKQFQQTRDLGVADEIITIIRPTLHFWISAGARSQAVDDVLQETLIAIFTNLDKIEFQSDAHFYGFCKGIARNKIVDDFRRFGRTSAKEDHDSETWDKIHESLIDILETYGDKESVKELIEILMKVRPPCAFYIYAHYIAGYSFSEIAGIFNFPTEAAAGVATRRCLKLARELIDE